MNTTFIINGGAGRILTSAAALEKYHRLNPEDDFTVLIAGWDSMFWSHPILQHRTYNINQKGTFEQFIKGNQVVVPDPYINHRFFNQEINIVEAFDEVINHTTDHSDLNYLTLHLSDYENLKIKEYIDQLKQIKKKKKVIVFQPFGSTVEIIQGKPIDKSNRSFELHTYLKIVQELSTEAVILFASAPEFRHIKDDISISFDDMTPYHRALIGVINHADYYIGCCSVGQHVARALGKPGLIAMGGTHEKNFSYPDHFTIYRKPNTTVKYVPWRLSDIDCEFADRENNGLMSFTVEETDHIIKLIKTNMNLSNQPSFGSYS